MCGIFGINGAFANEQLKLISQKLSHRGPDDAGLFVSVEDKIGLGHTRLSILDLSAAGHQPMIDSSADVAIVFNGEIYNYLHLREGLERSGGVFYSNTDTEVLLQLYIAEGVKMLDSLSGIFAFAIWDGKKKELFVARDALGVKPIYYFCDKDLFAFASEIKGLIPLLPSEKRVNNDAINRYMSFQWCPGNETAMDSVFKLGPGEYIKVRDQNIYETKTWYQLPLTSSPIKFKKSDSLVGELTKKLRSAVHQQLIADVPVGAFLSGGVDSSIVVALAREMNPDIHCFTIDPQSLGDENREGGDLPYARRVADYLKVPLTVVEADPHAMIAAIGDMVYHLDEPLGDLSALNVLYISHAARRNGYKVLLSGLGGDDLFTGYRRHRAVHMEEFLNLIPRYIWSMIQKISSQLPQDLTSIRRINKLASSMRKDGDERLVDYFYWAKSSDIFSLYSDNFFKGMRNIDAGAPMLNFINGLPSSMSPIDKMLALEQKFFLPDHNLLYTDKMSMAAGLEVRVPFLDPDLIRFAARIPESQQIKNSNLKWILKKVAEPFLTSDVIYRKKVGFGVPLRSWIRNELRPLVSDVLSKESLQARGFFKHDAVFQLIEENDKGRVDGSYLILSLVCVEMWCRRFIDQKSA